MYSVCMYVHVYVHVCGIYVVYIVSTCMSECVYVVYMCVPIGFTRNTYRSSGHATEENAPQPSTAYRWRRGEHFPTLHGPCSKLERSITGWDDMGSKRSHGITGRDDTGSKRSHSITGRDDTGSKRSHSTGTGVLGWQAGT